MKLQAIATLLVFVSLAAGAAGADANSVGMEFVEIPAGSFMMGDAKGYWDSQPAHKITISKPFRMSVTEVTAGQYRKFRPRATIVEKDGFATGVSWHDAVAFCRWLSKKEGKTYRLPTEAEWEYSCRTESKWGLKNTLSGPREWCYDWYGDYRPGEVTDPVGPVYGLTKVVRGGGLDNNNAKYATPANRGAIAPAFGIPARIEIKKPVATQPAQKKAPAVGGGAGLVGQWYGEPDFRRPKDRDTLKAVDCDWTRDTVRGKSWSGRWRGMITAPVTGKVTFTLEADGNATLLLNGHKITGAVDLVKGRAVPIVLSYSHHNKRESFLRLRWAWAGSAAKIVDASALSHGPKDLLAAPERGVSSSGDPSGRHAIGFRVVQAAMPTTAPLPYRGFFTQRGVKQNTTGAKVAGDASRPYYRKRYLLPTPPENCSREVIDAAGLHPSFRGHNHSPALEVCPNGDVLMVIYTSFSEYEAEVSLMAARLRFGAEQWDMPSRLVDFAGANDHAPLLWNDRGTLKLFWGNPRLGTGGAFPFQWTSSKDNGANWSEVRFPHFVNRIGRHSKQPINTALRAGDGTIYVASDGAGGSSVLWAGADDGKTWRDTGGRTGGRHTTFVLLKDGSILGMGGKNTNIGGFMPKSVSTDGGKTWKVSGTPFPALASNQRPSVLRLKSGRLLFACDYQKRGGARPKGITRRGALAALSDDEGKTWRMKKLVGTQQHERDRPWGETIGYSAARQGPNGMIHLITTMNRPCLHFEFNEAWILSDAPDKRSNDELMAPTATRISGVREYKETHPGGKTRIAWWAGLGNDGRHLLHGTETWYYTGGRKQYQATYKLGRKVGKETLWAAGGEIVWQWVHDPGHASVWTQYWPGGRKKARSAWRNHHAHGEATCWGRDGKIVSNVTFRNGAVARQSKRASDARINSVGMKFVEVPAGSFVMGQKDGAWDEKPVGKVTISKSMLMSRTEVTNAQYEQFDPAHKKLRGKLGFSLADDEAVVFVSWHEAAAFCRWLSKKESKPYRLPTEAEWEYACRAGTTTPYHAGKTLPKVFHRNVTTSWFPGSGRGKDKPVKLTAAATPPNPWGLCDMHGNVEEWCSDWYGPYVKGDRSDPVGRADGDFKVTRGGSHSTTLEFLRSANRSGTLPGDKSWLIGFRVVQGAMPATKPSPAPEAPLNARNVSRKIPPDLSKGPDPAKPWFKGPLQYVKVPPAADCGVYNRHNHCPAIVNCPNGDLLAVWYTCRSEPGRELGIVASRLPYGATEWQVASDFWDAPDRNDHASALWVDDKGTIYHFNGLSAAATWGSLATIMRTSTDSGATWSKAKLIMPEHGLHHMPVESVQQTSQGAIIVPCDAVVGGSGGTAVLISRDAGKTWTDPGEGKGQPKFADGTTGAWIAGIHAGFVQLKDGKLMALGRGDAIGGKMPTSISEDLGKTWKYSASPFPPIGGGQRLAILRLAEGPILFCSFGRNVSITGASGKQRRVSGLFAALTTDEGKTWSIKRPITDGGPARKVDGGGNTGRFTMSANSAEPKGYMSICQTPNGVIHLISSKQHYQFNLAWLNAPPK